MTGGEHTYLRVGGGVFPVYGDVMRGFSPLAQDFGGMAACRPYVYDSLDEVFFALVNLCAAAPKPGLRAHPR